jgi:hypothetical protein
VGKPALATRLNPYLTSSLSMTPWAPVIFVTTATAAARSDSCLTYPDSVSCPCETFTVDVVGPDSQVIHHPLHCCSSDLIVGRGAPTGRWTRSGRRSPRTRHPASVRRGLPQGARPSWSPRRTAPRFRSDPLTPRSAPEHGSADQPPARLAHPSRYDCRNMAGELGLRELSREHPRPAGERSSPQFA